MRRCCRASRAGFQKGGERRMKTVVCIANIRLNVTRERGILLRINETQERGDYNMFYDLDLARCGFFLSRLVDRRRCDRLLCCHFAPPAISTGRWNGRSTQPNRNCPDSRRPPKPPPKRRGRQPGSSRSHSSVTSNRWPRNSVPCIRRMTSRAVRLLSQTTNA